VVVKLRQPQPHPKKTKRIFLFTSNPIHEIDKRKQILVILLSPQHKKEKRKKKKERKSPNTQSIASLSNQS
jgi:hypothetical protein